MSQVDFFGKRIKKSKAAKAVTTAEDASAVSAKKHYLEHMQEFKDRGIDATPFNKFVK